MTTTAPMNDTGIDFRSSNIYTGGIGEELCGVTVASSFVALPDIADTTQGSGLVTSWLQRTGTLVVGGNSSSIHVWDVSREQCVRTFSTGLETCTTCLTSMSSNPRYALSYPLAHQYRAGSPSNESNDIDILTWTFAGK